jgi:hypothetical protein
MALSPTKPDLVKDPHARNSSKLALLLNAERPKFGKVTVVFREGRIVSVEKSETFHE